MTEDAIDPKDIAELDSRIGLFGSLTQADVTDPIFNIIVATATVCGPKGN